MVLFKQNPSWSVTYIAGWISLPWPQQGTLTLDPDPYHSLQWFHWLFILMLFIFLISFLRFTFISVWIEVFADLKGVFFEVIIKRAIISWSPIKLKLHCKIDFLELPNWFKLPLNKLLGNIFGLHIVWPPFSVCMCNKAIKFNGNLKINKMGLKVIKAHKILTFKSMILAMRIN